MFRLLKNMKTRFNAAITGTTILLSCCAAQQNNNSQLLPDLARSKTITPFFEKTGTIGSPYLGKNWMQGVAELSDHRVIPEPGQPLLFNFDKTNSVLYTINAQNKISSYPTDSVISFNLSDGYTAFPFEKVSWISDNFFLIPITKSVKGYSLYKRIFTKFIQANFSDEGYYTKGKKFDEYADYFEYYVTYPENRVFRKLNLREKDIRKALKDEDKLLDEFFSLHDNEINEQSLIGIIQYIDDKKFPE